MSKPIKTEDGLLLVDCFHCNGQSSGKPTACDHCQGDGGFLMTEEQYRNYIENYYMS